MDEEAVGALLAQVRKFGTEATSTELKASRTDLPKSTRETLSAFSNTPGGGILVLGVEETRGFTVSGVNDPSKIQSDLASLCRNEMQPALSPDISVLEVEGRVVVVADIPELARSEKPCF